MKKRRSAMKRLASIIGIVAASVIFTSGQVMAAETAILDEGVKNECLLVAKNCSDDVDSIQQRIEKLDKELSKGTDVYTRDELKILGNKLEEERNTLDMIEHFN
jgi:hypothetical protein